MSKFQVKTDTRALKILDLEDHGKENGMRNQISNGERPVNIDKSQESQQNIPNAPVNWHFAQGDTCNDPNIDSDCENDSDPSEASQDDQISQGEVVCQSNENQNGEDWLKHANSRQILNEEIGPK